MATQRIEASQLGLWIIKASGAVVAAAVGMMVVVVAVPGIYTGQEWIHGLVYAGLIAAVCLCFGLWFWASFKTAEKIAAVSERAEANGRSPLINIALAGALGLVVFAVSMGRDWRTMFTSLDSFKGEGALLEAMFVGAPFVMLVIAMGMLAVHRMRAARDPDDAAAVAKHKKAEQIQTWRLALVSPLFILVPYFLWISVQP